MCTKIRVFALSKNKSFKAFKMTVWDNDTKEMEDVEDTDNMFETESNVEGGD